MKTKCKIKFFKETDELVRVCLEGNEANCLVAEKIILLAVRHNQNSILEENILVVMSVVSMTANRVVIDLFT